VCVACSGRFVIENGTLADHETAQENERERLDEEVLEDDTPPSRSEDDAGPSHEEEMRGAQPPNAEPSRPPIVEREDRPTGKTAEIVDLDEVNETGSGRSAHWSHDP
jgi:hypothetical protein